MKSPVLWISLLLLALAPLDALAQANLRDPSGEFDGLLQLINLQASQWAPRLRNYALALFWGLAGIQFVWSMGQLAFKGADLSEVVGELVRQVMTIGFWLAFLVFSVDWTTAIVDSFRQAAATASGTGLLIPADVFGQAVELAMLVGNVQTMNPAAAIAIAISAALILVCFVFIATLMAIALIESFIVINAGVLLMGFAGASWTREVTVSFVKYSVSVGAKLFILTLLVGMVMSSAVAWAAAYQHSDASMWTLVGLALVSAYMCKTVPEQVQALISGASMGGGGAMGGIAAAGAAFAMAATSAAAAVATGGAAAPLAALGAANSAGGAAGAAGAFGAGSTGAAGAFGAGSAGAAGGGAAGTSASAAGGLGGRLGGAGATGGTPAMPPSTPTTSAGSDASAKASGASSVADAAVESEASEAATSAVDTAEAATPDAPEEAAAGGGTNRALTAATQSAKAAHALAAMVAPGIEASPDAAALVGDSGGAPKLEVEDGNEAAAPPSRENIIRAADSVAPTTPEPAPAPTTSTSMPPAPPPGSPTPTSTPPAPPPAPPTLPKTPPKN